MKKITELDKKLPHPDPSDDVEKAKKEQDDMPTLRKLLRVVSLNMPPKTIDESDELAQIALKLRMDGDEVDLEDAGFRMLNEHVERNSLQWPAHIHNYVLNKMREAKTRKPEAKAEEKAPQ